jgi:hypothetical protein
MRDTGWLVQYLKKVGRHSMRLNGAWGLRDRELVVVCCEVTYDQAAMSRLRDARGTGRCEICSTVLFSADHAVILEEYSKAA